jgi:hypothetical protein
MRWYQVPTWKFGKVIAPSLRLLSRSTSASMSTLETRPRPSHSAHMPPVIVISRDSVSERPFSSVISPLIVPAGTLKLNALDGPMCGWPSRLKMTRSMSYVSVAVPTVERALAPIRSWSTMIAAVRFSSESTSGRARVGMKPWTKAV